MFPPRIGSCFRKLWMASYTGRPYSVTSGYGQISHLIEHIRVERRQSLGEILHQVRHQAVGGALGEVHIPAAHIDRGDLESQPGFDEHGRLFKR